MRILVTGGAGFIGSALCRMLINETEHHVLNVDKLTYAANLASLASIEAHSRYSFEQADITDDAKMYAILEQFQPDAVCHLAAESHVDRSIEGPEAFIQTNVIGTYRLLEGARAYWSQLPSERQERFRFLHISTDEVYGTLMPGDPLFSEETTYSPNSPYAASKAGSDHLVRAWYHTYGLPTLMSNCSNNYGPFQFPEKLIPLMITNALRGKPLPVYGEGSNIRDWLFVDDHARALITILESGDIGGKYNVGGHNEVTNLDVVKTLCCLLAEKCPDNPNAPFDQLITFVTDRPGHDFRYAIDASKIQRELNFTPTETFETGLSKTVDWYLNNQAWWHAADKDGQLGERLGLIPA